MSFALTRGARAPQLHSRLRTTLQRRLESTEPPVRRVGPTPTDKKSFRGQLYESTARRVQEERMAQVQRVAVGRATGSRPDSGSGRTLSALFSTHPPTAARAPN